MSIEIGGQTIFPVPHKLHMARVISLDENVGEVVYRLIEGGREMYLQEAIEMQVLPYE